MTKTRITKRALLMSALSLVLCISMLVGSTFAWFTDSVTSANNVIKSGKLDVELYYQAEGQTEWTKVTETTNVFKENALWEPGYTEVVKLKVVNEGSLALKYQLGVNIFSETGSINVDGKEFDLSDYIKYGIVDGAQTYTREQAIAAVDATATSLKSAYNSKTIKLLPKTETNTDNEDIVTMVVYMPTTVGNDANHAVNANVPTINLGVNLYATQVEAEIDSFDNTYDENAWAKGMQVYSAQDLQSAIDAGETSIVLTEDIDLTAPIVIPDPAATTYSMRAASNAIVINLNGNAINAPFVEGSTTNHIYAFENYGNVVFTNGTINARGIFNYGTMTLEKDITINAIDGNGGYAIRNYEGATLVMNGGTIATTLEDDHKVDKGGYDATTVRVDAGATFEMNGGTINNISDWTFAIDNNGTTTINDGVITSVHSTVSSYGNLTINGGSFTCNGLEGVTAHALVVWDGSVTDIYGGTFDGKDNYNGFNVDAVKGSVVNIYGGNFLPVHSGSLYGDGTINVYGGTFADDISNRLAEGTLIVVNQDGTKTVVKNASDSTMTLADGAVLDLKGNEFLGKVVANGDLTIKGDTKIKTLSATNGGTITIEDGKTLTLNNFSFGSKSTNTAEYTITGGTVTANYGFFQHGTYDLYSDFETGYMYYSYGSDITVYGTFHSQGKGDGLDYVRGKLTIANGGKSIHDKSLWVGQPASWGAMSASLTVEKGGYVQANSLSVYDGSVMYNSAANLNKENVGVKYNKLSGNIITFVDSADQLAAAAANGVTNVYLLPGEYDVYGCAGKTLTINGTADAVIKLKNEGENGCDYAFGDSTGVGDVTFNGVTIDTTSNTGSYKGFAYMKGTFNNCNFVGAYSLNNNNDFEFNNCTFDFKNGYFWTWGAKSVTFNGCTFNGNSKAILAHGYSSTVININNCTFAATEKGYTGAGDNTAVVEIDPAGTNTYTINFTGENTKTEAYAGWTRVKDGSTGHIIEGLN